MHADTSVHKSLARHGINRGWDFAFNSLENDFEPLRADEDEYMDILSEAALKLRAYGVTSATDDLPEIEKIIGMEVGDDRKDESNSPTGLAVSLVAQESIFKMITSEEDTFISKSRSNFCEVTTIVPRSIFGNFDYARKTGGTHNLEYVDVMPLRIVIDVSKSNNDHSSTVPGKASLAGPKMAFCREEFVEELTLANLLQDGYLLTYRSKEPKYLPVIMGGCGAPPLYGSSRNLYLYMMAYRGGGYSRVYGTATNEVMTCLTQMEETGTYRAPEFTFRLRSKEEYLRITYKGKVFVPKRMYNDIHKATSLPPPLYESGKTANEIALGESRLLNAKLLITRTQAEVEVERTRRNHQVLFGHISVEGERRALKIQTMLDRKEFDCAVSGNSAVARMLERRANDSDEAALRKDQFFGFTDAGEREFHIGHARWITGGCKSNSYDIRDLRRPEDIFIRSEVSTEEEMKVSGISRIWVKAGNTVMTETTNRVGLWQVSSSMYEHAEVVLSKLVKARDEMDSVTVPRSTVTDIYYNCRQNTADDGILLQQAVNDTKLLPAGAGLIVLVSTDTKLARVMAEHTKTTVVLVSPASFIPKFGKDAETKIMEMDHNPPVFAMNSSFHAETKLDIGRVHTVLVDTGSLQSALAQFATEPSKRKKKELTCLRRPIYVGYDVAGRRLETMGLTVMQEPQGKVSLQYNRKDKLGRYMCTQFKCKNSLRIRVSTYQNYFGGDTDTMSDTSGTRNTDTDSVAQSYPGDNEYSFKSYLE